MLKKTTIALLALLAYNFFASVSWSESLKIPKDKIDESLFDLPKDYKLPDPGVDFPKAIKKEDEALFNLKKGKSTDTDSGLPISTKQLNKALLYLRDVKLPNNDIDFPIRFEEKFENIKIGTNKQVVKTIMYLEPSEETMEKLIFEFGKKWDQPTKRNFRAVFRFKENKMIEKYVTYDGYLTNLIEARKGITTQE